MTLIDEQQATSLLAEVDALRSTVYRRLDPLRRVELGQFFTPAAVASFMASMLTRCPPTLRLLDAGAGLGALAAAAVVELCRRAERPAAISVTAYEVDRLLVPYLRRTLDHCTAFCAQHGVSCDYEIIEADFIEAAVSAIEQRDLFAPRRAAATCAILNPPYRKLNSASQTRRLLRSIGVETSNLYTAFVWLATQLLAPDGELVAITPRSFCNGPYFRPFRTALLDTMSVRRVHVFETRTEAFGEDAVLQENIILHAVKGPPHHEVVVTASVGPDDDYLMTRTLPADQFVHPKDPERFIHLVPDELGRQIGQLMRGLSATLTDLGLSVSTGRVVDFRAAPLLRDRPAHDTAPLIYPANFAQGRIVWPNTTTTKPQALLRCPLADELMVPAGVYVLVKRFSAKEERRRVVAALYRADQIADQPVGFENHLNYFHVCGRGVPLPVARGLVAFLNSTLCDQYFRQFSGHTQVNASDLRNMPYPRRDQLIALGERVGVALADQETIDRSLKELFGMAEPNAFDPIQAKKKLHEALDILRSLSMPRAQQNDRSALTLLALLDVRAETNWSAAAAPLRGITEMMDWFKAHYGVTYAPNTRETVRRQTIHQLVQAGVVLLNPDRPARPVNSPDNRYQIEPRALDLIRTYGTDTWAPALKHYLASAEELKRLHAQEREHTLIPVRLPSGEVVTLSGGGQNPLIKAVVEQFCPRFTPGGIVVLIGDAQQKLRGDELAYLQTLGVVLDKHGKMPDVVVHETTKNWLVLIEAVSSHGPIDTKRHNELRDLFKGSTAPLVFVTAFMSRKEMARALPNIAWETEVWVADSPDHLIHFNGERFLGPYEPS